MSCSQELLDMHDELARFGVSEIDWRLANFLSAPPSPPGLPSLPSPIHGHAYTIRMFDFEFTKRANLRVDSLNRQAKLEIQHLLEVIASTPASREVHLPSVKWN